MYTVYCPGVSALPKSDDEEVDPEATECTYDINTAGLHEGAQRIARERAEGQISLLEDIRDQLEEVEAVFYSEDVPWQFVGHEYVSGSWRGARQGRSRSRRRSGSGSQEAENGAERESGYLDPGRWIQIAGDEESALL
jgi:hypothetical protein